MWAAVGGTLSSLLFAAHVCSDVLVVWLLWRAAFPVWSIGVGALVLVHFVLAHTRLLTAVADHTGALSRPPPKRTLRP